METYEQQVLKGVQDFFKTGNFSYVKDIRLDLPRTITVTFFDKHIGKDRDEVFDIYDEGINTSGRDYPESVGTMIGTHVMEEAEAAKKRFRGG
jgi:hypothetical protein